MEKYEELEKTDIKELRAIERNYSGQGFLTKIDYGNKS